MGHGGRRNGAGRKKGSLSKRTQEIVAGAAAEGVSPLEFMLNVLRDPDKAFEDRFKAAIQAAPYMHPRLSQVDGTMHVKRDLADMSDQDLEDIAAGRSSYIAPQESGESEPDSLH